MSTERSFTNAPDAPAHVRRFVANLLTEIPREIADEVAIMVSELATNCVRHTVTDFTVRVEQTPSDVRVDVTDTGGGMPQVRSPELSEPSGRGLRIVQELSDSFGITERKGAPGKTVWFVVRLTDHLADHSTRAMADGSEQKPPPRPDPGTGSRPRTTRSDGSRSRPEASCRGRSAQGGLPASRSCTLE
jgi:anti-sigma regulatory factor (Ser/Thr protein kinase)